MRSTTRSVFAAGTLAMAGFATASNADAARRCRATGVSDSCVTRHVRHMRIAPLADPTNSYNSFYSGYGPSETYRGYNGWGTYNGYDGSGAYSGYGASGTPRWPPSGGAT
jgi:hypothetical protein